MRVSDPELREVKAIRRLVDLQDKSVLEIGCGDGRLTWRYAEDAARVTAIDPVDTQIAAAIAATPPQLRRRVRFKVADATTVRLRPAVYDAAILSWSL